MSELKSINIKEVPFKILRIFRRMYNKTVPQSIGKQILNGIYLAYLCCIYIAWYVIALFTSLDILNSEYYGTICMYFIALSIVSHMLHKKLKKLMGTYNYLRDMCFVFQATETSVEELTNSLIESESANVIEVYRPCMVGDSQQSIDLFFKISDAETHKLYVLKYFNPFEDTVVMHIIDSEMIKKRHVFYDAESSTLSVF